MFDVTAIKADLNANGHDVCSVRNAKGTLRGSVCIHLRGRWDDADRPRRAVLLSEYLRATYPGIRFVGNDVFPAEFCAHFLANN